MIRARVEPALKRDVEGILEKLGVSPSEAVNMFYRQVRIRRGLPFLVRLPNATTRKTIDDSRKGKGLKRFRSKEAFYKDLGLR